MASKKASTGTANKSGRRMVPVIYDDKPPKTKKSKTVMRLDMVKDPATEMYSGELMFNPPITGRLMASKITELGIRLVMRTVSGGPRVPMVIGVIAAGAGCHAVCPTCPKEILPRYGGKNNHGHLPGAGDVFDVSVDAIGVVDEEGVLRIPEIVMTQTEGGLTEVDRKSHSLVLGIPVAVGTALTAVDPEDEEYSYMVPQMHAYRAGSIEPQPLATAHYTLAAENHVTVNMNRAKLERLVALARKESHEQFWLARLAELAEEEKAAETPEQRAEITISLQRAKTADVRPDPVATECDKVTLKFYVAYEGGPREPDSISYEIALMQDIKFLQPRTDPEEVDKFSEYIHVNTTRTEDISELKSLNGTMMGICSVDLRTAYSEYIKEKHQPALEFLNRAHRQKLQILTSYAAHKHMPESFDLGHTEIVNQLACLRAMRASDQKQGSPFTSYYRLIAAACIASQIVAGNGTDPFKKTIANSASTPLTKDETAAIQSCDIKFPDEGVSDAKVVGIARMLGNPELDTFSTTAFLTAIKDIKSESKAELATFGVGGPSGAASRFNFDDGSSEDDDDYYSRAPRGKSRVYDYIDDEDDDDYLAPRARPSRGFY